MIELDELLHGNPSFGKVAEYFKNGEFYEEGYLTAAIKKYLRDEEDKKKLFELDYSIEDMLNGRTLIDHSDEIEAIFNKWNKKLGFIHFRA